MDLKNNLALGLTPSLPPQKKKARKPDSIVLEIKKDNDEIERLQINLDDLKNDQYGDDSSSISSIKSLPRVDSDEVNFRRSTFWKSCCGTIIDKRSLQYFVQVGVSAIVMSFCMYKIGNSESDECHNGDTVYIALLSSIVGFYIPAPQLHID